MLKSYWLKSCLLLSTNLSSPWFKYTDTVSEIYYVIDHRVRWCWLRDSSWDHCLSMSLTLFSIKWLSMSMQHIKITNHWIIFIWMDPSPFYLKLFSTFENQRLLDWKGNILLIMSWVAKEVSVGVIISDYLLIVDMFCVWFCVSNLTS